MTHDRRSVREVMGNHGPRICPSLLNCDFGNLASEIADAQRCGAASVHWDVMDGAFVPNFTYGPPIIKSLRPASKLVFDAHLMMSHPEKYLDAFLDAGCDILTIHLEAVPNPRESLERIRNGGALAGLAINPPTPVERLEPWLGDVDLVLIMSVMPGFGGQSFNPVALEKLEKTRTMTRPEVLLQVDGGINLKTMSSVAKAGAGLFVVGSAFYGAKDRKAEFDALMRQAHGQPL